MKVERIRLAELTPDPDNAKDHPAWQVDQIKASIEQFGNLDPIGVWGPQNLIVEGHGRYEALKELGYQEAEVIRLDQLTDEERRAYALAHNQTTMTSGFDPDLLKLNLDSIQEIDMSLFGFRTGDWFTDRERNDTSRQEGNDEYNEFLDKFEQPKTTDDCYTPDLVYEAVAEWVENEYGVSGSNFVRPFYPGGDYQAHKYKSTDIVVDNPPFSILAEILAFYCENKIPFFLFAPTLTLFSGRGLDVSYLPAGVGVTYENGASVNTSFITNMEKAYKIRTVPTLYDAVKRANDKNLEETKKAMPKYEYPAELVTAAGLSRYSVHGVDFCIRKNECERVQALDAMKSYDKAIFGGGYLLSEEATKRNIEATKKKAENIRQAEMKRLEAAIDGGVDIKADGIMVWKLSDRELEIVKGLGDHHGKD